MTGRLYYRDATILEFEATIVEVGHQKGRDYTVLDRSAFYPTSGGQFHDTGTLNDIAIVDVVEADDDAVRHISERAVGSVGDTVHGMVDGKRRLRHRQLHTAQHVLSQAFIRTCELETVSVHLGWDYGAVELDARDVSDQQLLQAEQLARSIIEADLPVEMLFVTSDEATGLPLRKVPDRQGTIRVIKIDDFDWSACGGTHCSSTAEVGLLKLVGVEKMRGRPLVKFLAGGQVYEDYDLRFDATSRLTRQLTCHVTDLPEKVERLATESTRLRKEVAQLQKELLPVHVERLAQAAETVGDHRLVVSETGIDDDRAARQLAGMVAQRITGLAVLMTSGRLLIAASPESGLDAGQLARQFGARTGLKGGGNRGLAQIGAADRDRLASYKEVIVELLRDA